MASSLSGAVRSPPSASAPGRRRSPEASVCPSGTVGVAAGTAFDETGGNDITGRSSVVAACAGTDTSTSATSATDNTTAANEPVRERRPNTWGSTQPMRTTVRVPAPPGKHTLTIDTANRREMTPEQVTRAIRGTAMRETTQVESMNSLRIVHT